MPKCPVCGDELDPTTGVCRLRHEDAPAADWPVLEGARKLKRRAWRTQWVLIAAVIGGIAACLGILVPAIFQAREAARRSASKNNLKQIGLALHNYHEIYAVLPPGGVFNAGDTPFFGWPVSIMPSGDVGPEYSMIDFNVPWNDARNVDVFRRPYRTYLNPSVARTTDSQGFVLSHYAANRNLMFPNSSTTFADITDGLANTIMAGEIAEGFLPYAQPGNWRDPAAGINAGPQTFGRPGGNGVHFLMADGSVRFFTNSVDLKVLQALGTPAGGEQVYP